jgi:hypothetical protein
MPPGLQLSDPAEGAIALQNSCFSIVVDEILFMNETGGELLRSLFRFRTQGYLRQRTRLRPFSRLGSGMLFLIPANRFMIAHQEDCRC